MLRWILLVSSLFLLTACDTSTEAERPTTSLLKKSTVEQKQTALESSTTEPAFEPLTAFTLLKDTTEVHTFETTAEAVSVWRRGIK